MNSLTVCAFDVYAEADVETRTIAGIAVPYSTGGSPGGTFAGRSVEFVSGSLTRSLTERADKVRLIVDHDRSRAVGRLTAWEETPEGLHTTWKVARTAAGDAVLAEAADGVRDGLSVGVDVITFDETPHAITVTEARLVEVSLVAFPAFDAARVDRVAATESPARGIDPRTVRYRLALKG